MIKCYTKALAFLLFLIAFVSAQSNITCDNSRGGSFFDLSAKALDGSNYSFSQLKGQVVLVMNVAR